jgi:hypothetical protein
MPTGGKLVCRGAVETLCNQDPLELYIVANHTALWELLHRYQRRKIPGNTCPSLIARFDKSGGGGVVTITRNPLPIVGTGFLTVRSRWR